MISVLWVSLAQANEKAAIFCDDKFSEQIREIDSQITPQVDSCVADLIWGSDNVCYKGSADILVIRINQGDYIWKHSGLWMQEASSEDSTTDVSYTGVDQMNFFATKSTISPCQEN